jgi:hypothetical protein
LRKTLFELDIHKEMMHILKRKYFPPVPDPFSEITVDQHFKDIGLQGETQEMVRSCLRASGRSAKKEKIKSYIENPEWTNKSELSTKIPNNNYSQPGQDLMSADFTSSPAVTHVTSLLVDRPEAETGDVT